MMLIWNCGTDKVVRVGDLKVWLRGKQVDIIQTDTSDGAYYNVKLIDDLLQEIEDAEKEG